MNLLRLLQRFERGRRLWRLVEVQGPDDCWPWRGEVDPSGEPRFGGRPAAMEVYERARGPIPPGWRLERRCPDVICVNPEHMAPRQDG